MDAFLVLTMMPAWSFTSLSKAELCLRQYHHLYVLKDLPFEETEALKWGKRVHEAMEKRLRDGVPLADGMQTYETFVPAKSGRLRGLVEYKVGIKEDGTHCGFFDDGVWGRGKLDFALVEHDSKQALIVDWKTGKPREDPDELEIFAVLLKAKYPTLERITGWYVWLKENRMGKVHDLSDVDGKLKALRERVKRLEHAHAMDAWPAQQGPLCGWCAVRSCEFRPK